MAELRTSPHSLAFDALVQVQAKAYNLYGWGDFSPVNTLGAKIRRVPNQMAPPVATAVTESKIDIQWTALAAPNDGNSAVLAYVVYWNNGNGVTDIVLLD
jgi:hypothetical protein